MIFATDNTGIYLDDSGTSTTATGTITEASGTEYYWHSGSAPEEGHIQLGTHFGDIVKENGFIPALYMVEVLGDITIEDILKTMQLAAPIIDFKLPKSKKLVELQNKAYMEYDLPNGRFSSFTREYKKILE